jgi:hypothetical protein
MNIHEYTGKDPWGMPDATQCECDCGWKLGGSAKTICNPPTCDDWDEWKKKAQDLPRLALDLDEVRGGSMLHVSSAHGSPHEAA